MRAPKGEVTSPRTGHSVGTPRLTSATRSFSSTVSTANATLAGDQLALVTKLRVEPSHLVAQRGAPPLGLPHLLGSNGHGEDHERGGETPTPSRARDMTRATGMRDILAIRVDRPERLEER